MRQRLTPKPDPVGHPASGSRLWNVPNGLTMLRLVLVIPFGILLFGYGDQAGARAAAAIIFALASLTDYFDGALARKHNLVTTFGKIADPLADKALTGVALVGLSYLGDLPWWVTIVILAREIGVTILRFWVIRHGVIAASRGGKAKTATQIVAILLYLMPLTGFLATFRIWVMGLALVLAIVTGIDYLIRALKVRQRARLDSGQPRQ
ncbi:MAG: CDP-diacylglycerol--glycerol-3-phosphate 3-phosphatidyltransferase [Actinobacteria bacterium]|nr:CDP-diacylglycerol--glycerol-3-phosphate 3-phosphatidyltransferase [Actinomycetota bacterium]